MRQQSMLALSIVLIGAVLQSHFAGATDLSDIFTHQPGFECADDNCVVQAGITTQDACVNRCLSIPKCFCGTFSGGQCKLKDSFCSATRPAAGANTFSRRGFRKCLICRSATLCPITQRTCYTLGKCARNNGENGIWQQTCDCDPSMSVCCDGDFCNCIGDQCRQFNQTTARTSYAEVYPIYSIWYRRVNSGRAIPNPLKVRNGYAAAMPSFMKGGAAFQRRSAAGGWGQKSGSSPWGKAPSWG